MQDTEEITRLARKYFDALYSGDIGLFEEIFHPDARLYSNAQDEYLTMSVPEYLELVRGRVSPAERGDARRDEILSISVASPTTAHLRVRELFLPKHFTDELTLMRQGGRWRIVSKVWDFERIGDDRAGE